MSDYLSGRETSLVVGIDGYTNSKTVLEVIGDTVLKKTYTSDLYADTLNVAGTLSFSNFSASSLVISGIITANKFVSTVGTGTAPFFVNSSTLVSNFNAEYLNGYPSSYFTNANNLSSGIIPASRLSSSNDFSVLGDFSVSKNVSVAGTIFGRLAGTASFAATSSNLYGGNTGYIPYQNSIGITTFLAPGAENYILLSGGPNTPPVWGPASSAAQAFTGITIRDEGNTKGTPSQITAINFVGPIVSVIANTGPTGVATVTFLDSVSLASTSTNLSGGARGSVPFQNSSGVTTLLPAGVQGQVFISGGPTGDPYWANVNSANGSFGGITIQKDGTTQGTGSSITTINFVGPVSVVANTGPNGFATVTFNDYVTKSGVSTNVVGGYGDLNSLKVTGFSTISLVQFNNGDVTASRFFGDGSGLTGINVEAIVGVTTYATSAGVATNVSGGYASVNTLTVTGASELGTVKISSGIVTATKFYGDGSGLTGINVEAVVGIITYANSAGVATYAQIAGFATASGTASVATNVNGGIATVTSLNVSGSSSIGGASISSGIVTATKFYGDGFNLTNLNISAIVGNIAYATSAGVATNVIGGIASVTSLNVSSSSSISGAIISSGIVTATKFYGDGSGLTNININSLVGTTTYSNNAGIASYAVIAGIATNVISGIASVTTLKVSGVGTNLPVSVGSGNSIVVIDSLGEVGIRTSNPVYPLDVIGDARVTGNIYTSSVISLGSNVNEIIRNGVGLVTTTDRNTITIDNYNTNLYRSAKYVIQISSKGSLIPGTTSISSITGGSNYFPGTYTNQSIFAVGGGGTQSIATLTVIPEYSLSVNSCVDGVFTSSSTLPTGLTTNQTVYCTQNLNLSQRQQSQISTFTLSNAGVGYTTTPGIDVDAPIIANNPVPEVGVGSTARLSVTSMKVSNAIQTSAGFVTNVIPTITFGGPSIGVTATGQDSFGIPAFNMTSAGSGYTVSPSLSVAAPYNPAGLAVNVGLGISSFNWVVSGGSGYTPGEQPVVNIIGGGGSGAAISAIGVGASLAFTITNPGIGYSTIPTVTIVGGSGVGAGLTLRSMIVTNINVSNPGTGVTVGLAKTNDITILAVGGVGAGAGATATTLVTSGISIINPGFGYSVSPSITYSPSNSGVATVGLGISAIQQLSTGIGYTIIPNATITPGPSIGTTVNVSISTSLGYAGFAGTTIIAGPGYGATSVYYINVLSNRTFNLSTSKGAGLTPGTGIVGYGFSVGLSTTRTGTLSIASTTLITGGISTSGITIGTPVQNNSLIRPGTTVIAIGINTITLSSPTLNTGPTTTPFIFGAALISGGKVNGVDITIPGSGYITNQSIGAAVTNFDRASVAYDSNVGYGFTFTVSSVASNFQLSEVLTMHSVGSGSTSAFLIEAAGISDIEELGEFSSTLSAGSTTYNLNFTPNYSYNEIKFNKTLFAV